MATVAYKIEKPSQGNYFVIVWDGLTATNTDGAWAAVPLSSEKSVHMVAGTWTGATIKLEGTNETALVPSKPIPLQDPSSAEIAFTADGLVAVLEHTYQIRPNVTTAGSLAGGVCRVLVHSSRSDLAKGELR